MNGLIPRADTVRVVPVREKGHEKSEKTLRFIILSADGSKRVLLYDVDYIAKG